MRPHVNGCLHKTAVCSVAGMMCLTNFFWWCRKALAEFRRTHEEAALAEAKRALQPDQWDALQSVASPASYFA